MPRTSPKSSSVYPGGAPPRIPISDALERLKDRIQYIRDIHGGTYQELAKYTGLSEKTLRNCQSTDWDPRSSTLTATDVGIASYLAEREREDAIDAGIARKRLAKINLS